MNGVVLSILSVLTDTISDMLNLGCLRSCFLQGLFSFFAFFEVVLCLVASSVVEVFSSSVVLSFSSCDSCSLVATIFLCGFIPNMA